MTGQFKIIESKTATESEQALNEHLKTHFVKVLSTAVNTKGIFQTVYLTERKEKP
jgi:hypothetical protein